LSQKINSQLRQGKVTPPGPVKNTDWSQQLRQAIAATGLSRYQIAKQSGVSQQVIGRFLKCERSLTLKSAERLGGAVGLMVVSTCDQLTKQIANRPRKSGKRFRT